VGSFAVIPRFETRATGASAAADRLHVVVRRVGDEELAADVTTDLDASGEGEVSIRVDLREDPEVFLVMLEAIQSSDGAVLYVGSTEVSVSASGTASATVPLRTVATQLVLTQQPVGGVSGAALAIQPVLAVLDAQGNLVTTDNTTQVTVTISAGVGGTLGGTQTETAAGGVVTFTTLTLAGTVGQNYQLRFGVAGDELTAAVSSVVNVTLGTGAVSDPAGDTFETSASDGLVPPDLVSFSAMVSGGSVTIQLDFAQPVAPATSQSPNVVVGFIDIDIDQNPATGNQATADSYRTDGGSTGTGVDYSILLFPDIEGRFAVLDVQSVDVGSASAQFTGNSIIVTVPLSVLGGDDGAMDLSTTVGTIPEPTDYAPNVGSLRIGGAAAQSTALGRRHPEGRASWGARR
jgi:hypothetical protein